jgi:hypothetical protein
MSTSHDEYPSPQVHDPLVEWLDTFIRDGQRKSERDAAHCSRLDWNMETFCQMSPCQQFDTIRQYCCLSDYALASIFWTSGTAWNAQALVDAKCKSNKPFLNIEDKRRLFFLAKVAQLFNGDRQALEMWFAGNQIGISKNLSGPEFLKHLMKEKYKYLSGSRLALIERALGIDEEHFSIAEARFYSPMVHRQLHMSESGLALLQAEALNCDANISELVEMLISEYSAKPPYWHPVHFGTCVADTHQALGIAGKPRVCTAVKISSPNDARLLAMARQGLVGVGFLIELLVRDLSGQLPEALRRR